MQQKLSIGKYTIIISNNMQDTYMCYLPQSANKFLIHEENKSQSTINYSIDLKASFSEPTENMIAGYQEGPCPYSVYRLSCGDYLWIRKNYFGEIHLAYQISKDWSSWKLIIDKSNNYGMDSFSELAFIFPYSILNKGGILFHGVVMEWNHMGIIVCAHSGVGKTTHTRMWRDKEGALILNGDRALCCKYENKWIAYGAPWCGSSDEYLNRSVELKMVVILEQAKENVGIMLSPLEGAFELLKLTFAPTWEENLINHTLDNINSIVQNIPVLKLKCNPEIEAVNVLKAEIKKWCM